MNSNILGVSDSDLNQLTDDEMDYYKGIVEKRMNSQQQGFLEQLAMRQAMGNIDTEGKYNIFKFKL